MTSKPASRSARATTLAPRSWPSSPGLAITIRIFPSLIVSTLSCPRVRISRLSTRPLPRSRFVPWDESNDGRFFILSVHGPKNVAQLSHRRLGFHAFHHVVHGILLPVGGSPQRIQRPTRLGRIAVGAAVAESVDLFTLDLGIKPQDGDRGFLGRDELVNADDDLLLAL